jgi:chromosome segregation ATPase
VSPVDLERISQLDRLKVKNQALADEASSLREELKQRDLELDQMATAITKLEHQRTALKTTVRLTGEHSRRERMLAQTKIEAQATKLKALEGSKITLEARVGAVAISAEAAQLVEGLAIEVAMLAKKRNEMERELKQMGHQVKDKGNSLRALPIRFLCSTNDLFSCE